MKTAANNNDHDEARGQARRQRKNREDGIARGKAHNQELHEQAQIRKHGGYQRALPI